MCIYVQLTTLVFRYAWVFVFPTLWVPCVFLWIFTLCIYTNGLAHLCAVNTELCLLSTKRMVVLFTKQNKRVLVCAVMTQCVFYMPRLNAVTLAAVSIWLRHVHAVFSRGLYVNSIGSVKASQGVLARVLRQCNDRGRMRGGNGTLFQRSPWSYCFSFYTFGATKLSRLSIL